MQATLEARLQSPRVGPPITGLIHYPRPIERSRMEKFKFDNWAEEVLRDSLNVCPMGTLVAFPVRVGEKIETRRAFTRENPFFLNGEVLVFVCGQSRAFRLRNLVILDHLIGDDGGDDGD